MCDSDALGDNILEWSKTVHKAFPLRLTTEFVSWWEDYWLGTGFREVPTDTTMVHLLFRLDFIAAMVSLVWDATFRGGVPDATDLRSKLIAELNPTCALVRPIVSENSTQAKIEIDEYLSTGTTKERRTGAIALAQSDIQRLCVRFWWKPHKNTFLAGDDLVFRIPFPVRREV